MAIRKHAMTKEKTQVSNSSFVIHCKDYESTFERLVFIKTRSTLDNNLIKLQKDGNKKTRNDQRRCNSCNH